MSAIGQRRFMARASWALAQAHGRYWSSVAPLVRSRLRYWETRARNIPEPHLKELARRKLANERFNVEVAAMIATTSPPQYRERTVEAIVALQVMYDYLDALTEQPSSHPIRDGLQYSMAFTDAVTTSDQPLGDYYAYYPGGGKDAGYLADLSLTVRGALRSLPSAEAVADTIPATAVRCAEAQLRIHATSHTGIGQLERWASDEARGTELQWREWLFGAMGSVVAVHALIASAADRHTTREQARELDDLYLSLCVLATVLDHLVDYDRDTRTGEDSYISLYETRQELALQIAIVVRRVIGRARLTRDGPHHVMILSGIVAYYTSQPSATSDFARPVTEHTRDQLRPLITPTLTSMYAWRTAKRLQARWQRIGLTDREY